MLCCRSPECKGEAGLQYARLRRTDSVKANQGSTIEEIHDEATRDDAGLRRRVPDRMLAALSAATRSGRRRGHGRRRQASSDSNGRDESRYGNANAIWANRAHRRVGVDM